MLGGVAPILIFSFKPNIEALNPLFNALSGIPLIGSTFDLGLPIPLYLDEKLTGLYVESEAKNLDLNQEIDARFDGGPPVYFQRMLNSSVTVNLLATRDSILLPALLALADLIVPKVVNRKYSLTYLNGPTVVFDGLLHSLSTSQGADDNLIRITLQIQKTHKAPENVAASLKNSVTGPTPIGA